VGVWIGRGTRSRIPIVVQWGPFDIEAALKEVDRAYRDGDIVPGAPRVLTPTGSYRPDTALVSDLERLQAHIAMRESAAPDGPGMSVIVVRDTSELPSAAVYAAWWNFDSTRTRSLRIVKSFDDAEAAVGADGLAADLKDVTRRGPQAVA